MKAADAQQYVDEQLKGVQFPEGWTATTELSPCPRCGEMVLEIHFSKEGTQGAWLRFDHANDGQFESLEVNWVLFVNTALDRVKDDLSKGPVEEPKPPMSGTEAYAIPGGTLLVMNGLDLLRALLGDTDD